MAAGKWNMQKASGGVASITVADGIGATNIVLPESGTVATISNIVGFKNYIINGGFDVWQYGASQTTSGYGSDDRWTNQNFGSTKTHSQVACTDTERALFNASKFSRTVVTSVAGVGNYVIKQQGIEDVTKFAGKTVTLSFWAKADSSKNIAIEFIQNFGTGGTPSGEILGIGSQIVALTSSWQKKTITFEIPSIIGKTLGTDGVHNTKHYLVFWFDAGSNYSARSANLGQQSGTFDIAQVQLEEGSVSTPFENRPYGLELSLCQRYFFSKAPGSGISLVKVGGTWQSTVYKFPVTMRVAPSVIITNTYQGDWGGLSSFTTNDDFRLNGTNGNNASSEISSFTASAEL